MSVVSETNTVFDLEEWVLMTERVLGGGFWCLINVLFLDLGIDYTGVFCLCKFSQLYTYGLHAFMYISYSSIKKPKFKHKNKTMRLLDVNTGKLFYNFSTKSFLTMTHKSEINTEMNAQIAKRKHSK